MIDCGPHWRWCHTTHHPSHLLQHCSSSLEQIFLSSLLSPFFSPISLPIYKTIFHAAAAASVFCFLSPEPSLLQRTCTAHFAFFTFKVMLQHSTWFSITSQHPTPHYTRWHHTRRTKITKNTTVRKTTPHSAKEVDSSEGISLVTNRMSKGENLNLTKYLVSLSSRY